MTDLDLCYETAEALARRIEAGELSARQVMENTLARIRNGQSATQLLLFRLRRTRDGRSGGGRRSAGARGNLGALARRPSGLQGPDPDEGRPHDPGLQDFRAQRGGLRSRHCATDQGGRGHCRGQDHDAGVCPCRIHALTALGHNTQSVGTRHARRGARQAGRAPPWRQAAFLSPRARIWAVRVRCAGPSG